MLVIGVILLVAVIFIIIGVKVSQRKPGKKRWILREEILRRTELIIKDEFKDYDADKSIVQKVDLAKYSRKSENLEWDDAKCVYLRARLDMKEYKDCGIEEVMSFYYIINYQTSSKEQKLIMIYATYNFGICFLDISRYDV